MNKDEILKAMKADLIPVTSRGLWFIHKIKLEKSTLSMRHGLSVIVPPGRYTYLRRITDATLYEEPPGEVVMEDTPFELQTHLGFVMQAYGNVLVTGLGLGCVIRGLLMNPDVESVTCIENSRDVLRMVAFHMPFDNLTIIEADALEWTVKNERKFDCAWHDLWTNKDHEEPHLDIWHAELFKNCQKFTKHQGAWAFPRIMKRMMREKGFRWMG